MTDKRTIIEQLSAYLDGELSAAQAKRVEEAIASDKHVAAELEQLRALRALLHDVPREKAPEDFVGRTLEKLERSHLVGLDPVQRRRPAFDWVRTLTAAAVLLLVLGAGWTVYQLLRPGQTGEGTLIVAAHEAKSAPGEGLAEANRTPADHLAAAPPAAETTEPTAVGTPIATLAATPTPHAEADQSALAHLAPAEAETVSLLLRRYYAGQAVTPAVIREKIDTPNLPLAQRDLEELLAANAITASWYSERTAHEEPRAVGEAANVYRTRSAGRGQVQYVVLTTADRARQLTGGAEGLRQSQVALAEREQKMDAMKSATVTDRGELAGRGLGAKYDGAGATRGAAARGEAATTRGGLTAETPITADERPSTEPVAAPSAVAPVASAGAELAKGAVAASQPAAKLENSPLTAVLITLNEAPAEAILRSQADLSAAAAESQPTTQPGTAAPSSTSAPAEPVMRRASGASSEMDRGGSRY